MFYSRSYLEKQSESSSSQQSVSPQKQQQPNTTDAEQPASAPEPASQVGLIGSVMTASLSSSSSLSHLTKEQQDLLHELEHRHDQGQSSSSTSAADGTAPSAGSCERCPNRARIAKPHLIRQKLEVGRTYRWCTCGYAKDESQPWCDDTCHTDPNIKGWEPLEYTPSREQAYHAICGCKYTKKPPNCDGSHIYLDW